MPAGPSALVRDSAPAGANRAAALTRQACSALDGSLAAPRGRSAGDGLGRAQGGPWRPAGGSGVRAAGSGRGRVCAARSGARGRVGRDWPGGGLRAAPDGPWPDWRPVGPAEDSPAPGGPLRPIERPDTGAAPPRFRGDDDGAGAPAAVGVSGGRSWRGRYGGWGRAGWGVTDATPDGAARQMIR